MFNCREIFKCAHGPPNSPVSEKTRGPISYPRIKCEVSGAFVSRGRQCVCCPSLPQHRKCCPSSNRGKTCPPPPPLSIRRKTGVALDGPPRPFRPLLRHWVKYFISPVPLFKRKIPTMKCSSYAWVQMDVVTQVILPCCCGCSSSLFSFSSSFSSFSFSPSCFSSSYPRYYYYVFSSKLWTTVSW